MINPDTLVILFGLFLAAQICGTFIALRIARAGSDAPANNTDIHDRDTLPACAPPIGIEQAGDFL